GVVYWVGWPSFRKRPTNSVAKRISKNASRNVPRASRPCFPPVPRASQPCCVCMTSLDTIAAISSSVGPAARVILRMSGTDAPRIASLIAMMNFESGRGGDACQSNLRFHDLSIPAWIYHFKSPHSYTGEELIEFHIPGNPLLARMLLDELLRLGARPAEPGEFTARAFFNGRLDLTAAEGVAATIAAHNQQELS